MCRVSSYLASPCPPQPQRGCKRERCGNSTYFECCAPAVRTSTHATIRGSVPRSDERIKVREYRCAEERCVCENAVVTAQVVKAPHSGNEGRSVGREDINNPEQAHEWGMGVQHGKAAPVRDSCSDAALC